MKLDPTGADIIKLQQGFGRNRLHWEIGISGRPGPIEPRAAMHILIAANHLGLPRGTPTVSAILCWATTGPFSAPAGTYIRQRSEPDWTLPGTHNLRTIQTWFLAQGLPAFTSQTSSDLRPIGPKAGCRLVYPMNR